MLLSTQNLMQLRMLLNIMTEYLRDDGTHAHLRDQHRQRRVAGELHPLRRGAGRSGIKGVSLAAHLRINPDLGMADFDWTENAFKVLESGTDLTFKYESDGTARELDTMEAYFLPEEERDELADEIGDVIYYKSLRASKDGREMMRRGIRARFGEASYSTGARRPVPHRLRAGDSGAIMNWRTGRFAENVRDYQGYPIGKTIEYLTDPEIISLAGGLPSPDVFPATEMRSRRPTGPRSDIDRIMQYSPIPGEARLVDAVLRFLERDDIESARKTSSSPPRGQHGLDIAGRLFLDPGDIVLVDRPTFAGALVAFEMQRPRYRRRQHRSRRFRCGRDAPQRSNELRPAKGACRSSSTWCPTSRTPPGITISLAKREALLDLSYEFDVPIIEDSPYRDLRYAGETIPAIFTPRSGARAAATSSASTPFPSSSAPASGWASTSALARSSRG